MPVAKRSVSLDAHLIQFVENEAKRDGVSFSAWVNRTLQARVNRLIASRRHVLNVATDEVLAAQPTTHVRKKKA